VRGPGGPGIPPPGSPLILEHVKYEHDLVPFAVKLTLATTKESLVSLVIIGNHKQPAAWERRPQQKKPELRLPWPRAPWFDTCGCALPLIEVWWGVAAHGSQALGLGIKPPNGEAARNNATAGWGSSPGKSKKNTQWGTRTNPLGISQGELKKTSPLDRHMQGKC